MARRPLPPNKAEVEGCEECPLRGMVNEDGDFETAAYECQHPEKSGRDVTGEEGVPDFCPLLRAPLLLSVAAREDE
jgi:hypothetical protein